MSSDLVVIIGIALHDPAQVILIEYNEMVQTFPPDRADQSFYISILPR
jgi:hypothetical protein